MEGARKEYRKPEETTTETSAQPLTGKIGEIIGAEKVEALTDQVSEFSPDIKMFGRRVSRFLANYTVPAVLGCAVLGLAMGMWIRRRGE